MKRGVRLEFYPGAPFLKMTILCDSIWLQHDQPGADVQMSKGCQGVCLSTTRISGAFTFLFYQFFRERRNNSDIPEYGLETDGLIYRDRAANEARRKKMSGIRTARVTDSEPTNQGIPQNVSEREQNEILSPFWMHQSRFFPGDFPFPGRQNFHGGLHPGGKEFSFLKSTNLVCESAGWIAII